MQFCEKSPHLRHAGRLRCADWHFPPPENYLGSLSEFSGKSPRATATPVTAEDSRMLMQAANSTPSLIQSLKQRSVRVPSGDERAGSIELMGAVVPFARNSEIFGENEPAD